MNKLSFESLYQIADVKRRINRSLILIALLTFMASIGLIVYVYAQTDNGLGITGLFVGTSLAIASVLTLLAKHHEWVFNPTGSRLKQDAIEVDPEHVDSIYHTIAQIDTKCSNYIEQKENSRILLECIYASDGSFAAFQMSHFSNLMYTPIMDVHLLSGKSSQEFTKWIKTAKQAFS